jgi:hypothetical protein
MLFPGVAAIDSGEVLITVMPFGRKLGPTLLPAAASIAAIASLDAGDPDLSTYVR